MIRFSKQWMNPLYFILNDLIKDNTIRTVLVYGGKSSAKTVSITQLLTKEAVVKQSSSIAFRKESTIIPTTLKKSFNLAMDLTFLYPAFERQDRRYLCNNGAEIILKGLDDSEKAKGVESYKYLYIDELNQFEQAEYEQFNLSLRGIEGQKIFASWNPVDENSWVKTELVDKYEFVDTEYKLPCDTSFVKKSTCGKVVLIKTTYEDNYWITGSPEYVVNEKGEIISGYGYRDENLIAEYISLKTRNYNSYRVNVLGEWGKVTFGGEFLKCWNSATHTGTHPYNPDLAIYLFFDENVNPYFPVGFFQISKDEKDLRLVHIIAAKNPNNKVSWMCREISRKLTEWKHQEHLYIDGDATSQKDDVKLEDGDDMFRLISNGLKEFKPIRRTSKSNPSVRMSADFVNSILEGNVKDLSIGVDSSCKIAIKDFESTMEDKNGGIDKRPVMDPLTKVSYQPFGHYCFVGETLIQTHEGEKRIDSITTDDFVLTRFGYKKVLAVHRNGIKKTKKYLVGNNLIQCTPEHSVFTFNKGFKKINSLLMCNDIFCIFDPKLNKICKQKLLVTEGQTLSVTQKAKTELKEFIIQGGLKSMEFKRKSDYTFINICVKLAKFLKAIIYTTRTKTLLITKPITLNYLHIKNIFQTTLQNGIGKIGNLFYLIWIKSDLKQLNGTNPRKGENGIVKTKKRHGQKRSSGLRLANNAEKNIKQKQSSQQNTANKTVEQQHCEDAEVFDLSISDCPEYFANNVLFHNCDILRYACVKLFNREYEVYQRGGKAFENVVSHKRVSRNSW